jgi:3-oxoacyl-[acyl-carrier protein] reductase
MMRFDGKVALVTAGTRGIGFAVAKGLKTEGARVAICGRDKASLDAAVKELGAFGLVGDIGDAAFLEQLASETRSHMKAPIDILVANNGGPPPGASDELSEEQWAGAIARNLMSAVRLTRLVAPGMKEKKAGRIVHLASTTAKEPDDGMVLSNTTRAAVAAFAKTMSRELGPHGITVNTVLTGAVLTDRLRSLLKPESPTTSLDQAIADAAKMFPVRYIPSPDEFARIVLFLASDDAKYLTGVALPADGGFMRGVM